MSKKIVLVLIAVVFFSGVRFAFAEVIINEFMSHPNSGEPEWIELLNTGNPVNLSGWKLTELTSPGTNPKENDLLSLSGTINDILVFEVGSSNLNDSGDSIGLYNGAIFVGRVTYGTDSTVKNYSINLAAPAAGKSGALISGVWETNQDPTKGTANPTSAVASSTSSVGLAITSTDNSSTSGTTTTSKIKTPEEPKIKTQIIAKNIGFVGLPLTLQVAAFGTSGEPLHFGKYFWNFGDGDSKEIQVAGSGQFSHTYFYPGDYTVALDYYGSSYQELPDASAQATIKIIPAEISISKVGDEKDFFIELTNNTDYSADLSSWVLVSDIKSFMLPHNTILQSKKKIIISPKISGFTVADQNSLKLLTPGREVVFEYGGLKGNDVVVFSSPAKGRTQEGSFSVSATQPPASPLSGGENATASVALSGNIPEKTSFPVVPTVSVFFIGAAAYGVYFIRRKKVVPEPAGDFEILDE
ncbi:PKD domain-containing protein [Candidatus Nomurabacteria bacterium]|nr:PKD domain-containing protein [Candidatus Nomurabacteria bacterium]